MSAQTPVPGLLRGFFEDYLAAQRDVSQNTIYAYRTRANSSSGSRHVTAAGR